MENIIISSDSTCDLYADYVLEHGIRIVPLHYTMEENGQLTEGVDSFTEYAQYVDFYNKLRAGGFSRTSMLNFDSHYAHFKKLAEEGAEKILHYSLSGGLSPTANVAKEAASAVMEKYPNCKIIAIDSLAATIGQGALVREAVRLRAEGRFLRGDRPKNGGYAPAHPVRHHRQRFVLSEAGRQGIVGRGGGRHPPEHQARPFLYE